MTGFYLRLIKRQTRLTTVRLFCIAVTIACAVTFSISLLSDRLEQLFEQQSKEVLAADLALTSTTPLSADQDAIIANSALKTARTLIFQTMANANDEFMLASVKATSDNYPLRGKLQISTTSFGEPIASSTGPAPGEIWVESRVLHQLNLSVGDFLNIGERSLPIKQILIFEPDRGGSFYSFTPRIMMNWQDIESTQVVQLGSRVRYGFLFAGDNTQLSSLKQLLTDTLRTNQKFTTIDEASAALATTLQRAYRFLHVTALIAILLGAVATTLVSYQYTQEMTYQYAVLRCLGLHGSKLTFAVLLPFILFTLLAITLGLGIGAVAHTIILSGLAELIPEQLPSASAKPYVISILTALVIVFSFTWPFLYKLVNTSPKLLLMQSEVKQLNIWLTFLSAGIGIFILVQLGISDWYLSVSILLGLFIFIVATYYFIKLIFKLFVALSKKSSVHAKLAARMLSANKRMVNIQIIAIGVTIFCLALIYTLRDDMLSAWQSKVPEDAPNFFVINLFEQNKKSFIDELNQLGLASSELYPIVRGRLTTINNRPVREVVSKESRRGDNILNRDLALTSATSVPKDNAIIQGKWHQESSPHAYNSISIESELAEKLGIILDDELEFTVDTATVKGKITSIRTVEWESFTPNFYMIFAPENLDHLPTTYIGSFKLTQEQRPFISSLVNKFPNASFFDVDFLLKRIQGISKQISFAIEIILYFSLAASLIVFTAIELILHHSRVYSTAVYKAVGAQTSLIKRIFRSQFIIVGITAGLFAYILNIIIGFTLTQFIIESEFVFNYKTALLCLLFTPLLIVISGLISVQKTQQTPAKKLLEQT